MSVTTPDAHTERRPTEDSRNPKAEVKAAKAYAKAVRPRYKKKRWWAAALSLIVVIISVAAGGASNKTAPIPSANSAQPTAQQQQPAATPKPELTESQQNAVDAANGYLQTQAFSKAGLIQQLSSKAGDSYPYADAVFAVNHIHVNWYQEAVKSARQYLSTQSFSKADLIQQLSSSAGERFTLPQAQYAVSQIYH